MNGIGLGAVMLIMFGSYGLALWYGSVLVIDGVSSAKREN